MGRPPDFGDYEIGNECVHCHEDLFHGETPKYVECVLWGLFGCPGSPYPAPIGTFLLQQTSPCIWLYSCFPYSVVWILEAGASMLIVNAPFTTFFFRDRIEDWCVTEFENELVICGPATHSIHGFGSIFWGPTIGPQSSFIQWEVGQACCQCQSRIFSGHTPKYVYAKVLGLKRCPFAGRDPPDGEFLLTQVTPCMWQGVHGVFTFVWNIAGLTSSFLIHDEVGNLYFSGTDPEPCQAFFANELNCFPLTEWAYFGGVKIKWGPWPVRPD